MWNNCNHQFVKVGDVFVCVYCGQVREVEENGMITIIKENGKIKYKENLSEHPRLD